MMRRQVSVGKASTAMLLALVAIAPLSACSGGGLSETHVRGYMASPTALQQIRPGSSQEQVLVVLGTPSTTGTVSGDVWYYVSQKTVRPLSFMKPHIVDQHVMAVYFGKDKRVTRLADYGLKDGKVFDFISRTTPTTGIETTFLQRALKALVF
jgi:outer membrane protein assembly factor BamE (lipoprotein component of BamABCDE complex)